MLPDGFVEWNGLEDWVPDVRPGSGRDQDPHKFVLAPSLLHRNVNESLGYILFVFLVDIKVWLSYRLNKRGKVSGLKSTQRTFLD